MATPEQVAELGNQLTPILQSRWGQQQQKKQQWQGEQQWQMLDEKVTHVSAIAVLPLGAVSLRQSWVLCRCWVLCTDSPTSASSLSEAALQPVCQMHHSTLRGTTEAPASNLPLVHQVLRMILTCASVEEAIEWVFDNLNQERFILPTTVTQLTVEDCQVNTWQTQAQAGEPLPNAADEDVVGLSMATGNKSGAWPCAVVHNGSSVYKHARPGYWFECKVYAPL